MESKDPQTLPGQSGKAHVDIEWVKKIAELRANIKKYIPWEPGRWTPNDPLQEGKVKS